jgi:hypothetical protein
MKYLVMINGKTNFKVVDDWKAVQYNDADNVVVIQQGGAQVASKQAGETAQTMIADSEARGA